MVPHGAIDEEVERESVEDWVDFEMDAESVDYGGLCVVFLDQIEYSLQDESADHGISTASGADGECDRVEHPDVVEVVYLLGRKMCREVEQFFDQVAAVHIDDNKNNFSE